MVLDQMQVDQKSNEITHAPTLLKPLDLRGVVVSGDAMLDQRKLSLQILQALSVRSLLGGSRCLNSSSRLCNSHRSVLTIDYSPFSMVYLN